MKNHRNTIKKNIKDSINLFKERKIDFIDLNRNIIANISALDSLDESIREASITLCGELETIHYMVEQDKEHEAMLKEIIIFERFINKI